MPSASARRKAKKKKQQQQQEQQTQKPPQGGSAVATVGDEGQSVDGLWQLSSAGEGAQPFLVATRDIPAGTCIYREEPLFVAVSTRSGPLCVGCQKEHTEGKKGSCPLLKRRYGDGAESLKRLASLAEETQLPETLLLCTLQSVLNTSTNEKQRKQLEEQVLPLPVLHTAQARDPKVQARLASAAEGLYSSFVEAKEEPQAAGKGGKAPHKKGKKGSGGNKEGQMWAKAALLHLLQCWACYKHQIDDHRSGLYKLGSCHKQSCDNNSHRVISPTTGEQVCHALRDIRAGEHITGRDAWLTLGMPLTERQQVFQKEYNYRCVCRFCTGDDTGRAFVCQGCPGNSSHVGAGVVSPPSWKCDKCGAKAERERVSMYEDWERKLGRRDASEMKIPMVVEAGVLHYSHHLIFLACDQQVSTYAQAEEYTGALRLLDWLLQSLPRVASENHVQRAVYQDMKGQVLSAMGKGEEAREAYRTAYEHRALTCGTGTDVTLRARKTLRECGKSTASR